MGVHLAVGHRGCAQDIIVIASVLVEDGKFENIAFCTTFYQASEVPDRCQRASDDPALDLRLGAPHQLASAVRVGFATEVTDSQALSAKH